ncbi:hypothetical protein [Devosia alba]|uniref:hypothetical protein n=1 Tax=Devosia alba TaxID=3152360 RepID=UPI003265A9A0
MSPLHPSRMAGTVAVLLTAALLLSGCTYDYLQHTDRVAFSSGNAVKANLERETIDPASMRSTAGLGRNGSVIPADSVAAPSP